MADTKPYRTGRAVRDAKRQARALRLRFAYHQTGDHRKLKRAKRIEQQLRLDTMRRMNAAFDQVGDAFRAAAPGLVRAVQRISEAFEKVRTPTSMALIAAAQAKGQEMGQRIAASVLNERMGAAAEGHRIAREATEEKWRKALTGTVLP